jgi:GT2 family glycosyltransferase
MHNPFSRPFAALDPALLPNPLLALLFDPAWYLDRYADAVRALEDREYLTPLDHYMTEGVADGRSCTPFFDSKWYVATYSDLSLARGCSVAFRALEHYLTSGCREGRSPNAIFDERWYTGHYGEDVHRDRYANGYHHFLAEGAAAACNPSPLFDEGWYRRAYPDVTSAIAQGLLTSGYHDYLRRPVEGERNPAPYFDVEWYRRTYPVKGLRRRFTYVDFLTSGAAAGYNPSRYFEENWYRAAYPFVHETVKRGVFPSGYHHYLYEGAAGGCAPNPYFLPKWYAAWYPDAREKLAAGQNAHAFEHYLCEGFAHGLSPNLYFDEAWYLRNNPDVADALRKGAVVSGHLHYLENGIREGRTPSSVFDPEWYRRTYPDVEEYQKNDLAAGSYDHFMRYGRFAGYSPCADFDELWYVDRYPGVRAEMRDGLWVDGLHHFVVEGVLRGYQPGPGIREDRCEQNITVTACARLELRDFLEHGREVAFPVEDTPRISIVLVLYNRAELTLRCLRSILAWTDVAFEVVIIDNASSDETARLLERISGARLTRNDRNLHFLAAANQGARAASGEYLLFLNNDCEIKSGAISSAVAVFEAYQNVGAVGGKIVLNNGVLQEAGSYLLPDGSSVQFGRGQAPFDSTFMHRRDVPYCSGAFLMTPRRLFVEENGFDPVFTPAYFEDVDYCLRLWQKGLRVIFNPGSIVLHHENASSRHKRFLYPVVMRNLSVLRSRYADRLATVPDYSRAPVGVLDGWRFRGSYLVIVDSIEGAANDSSLTLLLEQMLRSRLFVTLYPLEPWSGERAALELLIPGDVEVVAGNGIDDVEQFCAARKGVYAGGVLLSRAPVPPAAVRQIRTWLPEAAFFSSRAYSY